MIRDFKVINATLNQGDTTVLINDSFITNTSIIEIYTDNFNVFPIEGRQNGTQLTITFEKQLFDTHIKVLVNNIGDTLDVPEALSDLNDVDTTGLVNGYYLKYDGTKWIPAEVEGGSGTTDYNNLTNKPSINNVTLSGNKTSHDLSLADIDDLTAENISFDNTVSGMSADNVNEALDELSMTKQDTLTPGTNITITNNEISAAEPIAEALTDTLTYYEESGYLGRNLLNASIDNQTVANVTVTILTDGTIKLNGTASGNANVSILSNASILSLGFEKGKTYKLVGIPSSGVGNTNLYLWSANYVTQANDLGSGATFTFADADSTFSMVIGLKNGVVYNNAIIKPMITTDLNATYSGYTPYSKSNVALTNIVDSAIDGGYIQSKNLWRTNPLSLSASVGVNYDNPLKQGTYILKTFDGTTSGVFNLFGVTSSGNEAILSGASWSNASNGITFTTTKDYNTLRIYSGANFSGKLQIEKGTVATSYASYTPSNTELQSEIDGLSNVSETTGSINVATSVVSVNSVRKSGNVVNVSFNFSPSAQTEAYTAIVTIPEGYRPKVNQALIIRSANNIVMGAIESGGGVKAYTASLPAYPTSFAMTYII